MTTVHSQGSQVYNSHNKAARIHFGQFARVNSLKIKA